MKTIVLLLLWGTACATSRDKAPSPDVSRLDACLQELVIGNEGRCEYQAYNSTTGISYAVFIRTQDTEALRREGFPLDSVNGEVATARLTLEQLRTISQVQGVILVENPETATTTGP